MTNLNETLGSASEKTSTATHCLYLRGKVLKELQQLGVRQKSKPVVTHADFRLEK